MKPAVAVLIVSYNTQDLTLACLRSVFAETSSAMTPFEVVLVDNASSDGSADAIASAFPAVRLIRSAENLGFAGGNNRAAQEAAVDPDGFLLLLNPDTVVLEHAIDKLLAFAMAHPEGQIFGGQTLFADGTLNPASCWGRPSVRSVLMAGAGLTTAFPNTRLFNPEGYGGWRRDSVREVDIVSGCFLLIRKKVWDELRGFDPAFFMYGEEADLCWRATKAGYRCLICPEARIIHYGGASERVKADKTVRLFAAKARLFGKHWRRGAVPLGVLGLNLWAWTRMSAFGMASLVRKARAETFQTWKTVWRRRGEWRQAAQAARMGNA